MNVYKRIQSNRGVTLIELLAALALIGLVLGGSYTVITQGFSFKNIIEKTSSERLDTRIINMKIQDLFYPVDSISDSPDYHQLNKNGEPFLLLPKGEKSNGIIIEDLSSQPFLELEEMSTFSWEVNSVSGLLTLTLIQSNGIQERLTYSINKFVDVVDPDIEKTEDPEITQLLWAGVNQEIKVKNRDALSATITVKVVGAYGEIIVSIENIESQASQSFIIPGTVYEDDSVLINAKAESKMISGDIFTSVLNQYAPNNGIVIIEAEDGTRTFENFNDLIVKSDQKIIITSSIGDYQTDNQIIIDGGNGVVIEDGVSLTTNNNGNDSELLINSDFGDIIINNVDLTNTDGSSNHNTIEMTAKEGNIELINSIFLATRDIIITADNGYINASSAELTSTKGNIELTAGGDITVTSTVLTSTKGITTLQSDGVIIE